MSIILVNKLYSNYENIEIELDNERAKNNVLSSSESLKISQQNELVEAQLQQKRNISLGKNIAQHLEKEIEKQSAIGSTAGKLVLGYTDPVINHETMNEVFSHFDNGFIITYIGSKYERIIYIAWPENSLEYARKIGRNFTRGRAIITNKTELFTTGG